MYQKVADFKQDLQFLPAPPVFLNDIDTSTDQGKQAFNRKLMMIYDQEKMPSIPRCDCGHLNDGKYHGDTCPVCHSLCLEEHERPMDLSLWVRAPAGVHALMIPLAWIIISKFTQVKGSNMLDYLCDSTLELDHTVPWVREFESRKVPRGLNNFYRNFDEIMEIVYVVGKMMGRSNAQRDELKYWIDQNRSKLFAEALPVPTRMAFAIEKNDYGKFADESVKMAVNGIRCIVDADDKTGLLVRSRALAKKESMCVSGISELAKYWCFFTGKIAGQKTGLWRQNVYGTRSHFTARGVIYSISDKHRYDDCHLPWSMAVQLFKLHIKAKLQRGSHEYRPMTPLEQDKLIDYAVNNYHPLIDKIFDELLAEAPGGRISIILQRNPSLARGSAQLLGVSKITKDPAINGIALSLLILTAFNADFDGDELNVKLITDSAVMELLLPLAPHLGVMDLNVPRAVSSNIALPKPLISTLDHWMFEELLYCEEHPRQ